MAETIAAPFSSKPSVTSTIPNVSMVELIANPQKYQKKRIRVIGYFVYSENDFYKPPSPHGALYLSKDLAVYGSHENGLSVGIDSKNLVMEPASPTLKQRIFDSKYVAVEGTFTRPLDPWRFGFHLQASKIQILKPEVPAHIE